MQSFASNIGNLIPSRRYCLPDQSVASQILMYRQLLHTECKPGLRLSRGYEATDAQKKVKHMPWWEQGVETSKKMVISYDNLIVRLWLNGSIMPYVDGGYAENHSDVSVPKDDSHSLTETDIDVDLDVDVQVKDTSAKGTGAGDDDGDDNNTTTDINISDKSNSDEQDNANTQDGQPSHVNTLIDSKGLPPIPHEYWVDRLGFQQTDPVTDFRSGGVLSLAMLVHIVEACPNIHARFLPSGDAHMLPFGITCINVTDMIAKFCMFSKAFGRNDVLLSQKTFWRMFENPDSLLVLQELSMEVLCNVVVEMKRERKMPKVENKKKKDESNDDSGAATSFKGQDALKDVSVFDFAEILQRTEKRVNDDLLGSGPRTVDELREIHSRNCTKYLKAMNRKEEQARKALKRSQHPLPMMGSRGASIEKFSLLASAAEPIMSIAESGRSVSAETTKAMSETGKAVAETTKAMAESGKIMTENVVGAAGGMFNKIKGSETTKAVTETGKSVTENVVGAAGGVFDKIKGSGTTKAMTETGKSVTENVVGAAGGVLNKFKGFSLRSGGSGKEEESLVEEEIDFAKPPTFSANQEVSNSSSSDPQGQAKSVTDEAKELMSFDDGDADSKAEETKKEIADLLGDTTPPIDAADYFTIDEDDLI